MKPDSQSNTVLIDEIEEKKSKPTKKERKNELVELTCQTHDLGHETRTTQ